MTTFADIRKTFNEYKYEETTCFWYFCECSIIGALSRYDGVLRQQQ